MNVYSIYDKKVAAYGQPFFAANDGAAIRMVTLASQDRNSLLGTFPADYQLEKIGSWDESQGLLSGSKPGVVAQVALIVWVGDREESSDSEDSDPPFDVEEMNNTPS